MDEMSQQFRSRQRRKLRRKMGSKYARFIHKLLEAKKNTLHEKNQHQLKLI